MHQDKTIQAYQLRKGGTPARLAILRAIAADSVNNFNPHTRLAPGDWRGARSWTMGDYMGAYCYGLWRGSDTWYTHGGEQFRNERDAGDIVSRLPSGWYTDADCDETAVGIVACLPHGRFIAGYRWTSNDERVYFPEIFTDENDAATRADSHAEKFAESSREDSERFNAMQEAESHAEAVEEDVENAIKARNSSDYWREHCRERIEELRQARADLAELTEAYNRG